MEPIIKFRGQEIDSNKWLYGDLFQRLGCYPEIIFPYIDENGKTQYTEIAVKEKTVGQFIGFLDTHKKEIYQGDILCSMMSPDIIMVVVRDKNEASFKAKQITEFTDLDLGCHISQEWLDGFPKEIIGNIYDNPELLKTK